ncbi:MAG: flagella basal body P-ring formation protein FlgA [Syntrophus sp. (in: bacteria)]|nr:flagella basal body P-ring formation protein FlgA [Syntrophus sp. (in: bacteria)]
MAVIRCKVQGKRLKVQGTRYKVRESEKAIGYRPLVCTLLVCILYLSPFTFHLSPSVAHAAEYSATEAKIIQFVKEVYNPGDDVQVRLNSMPNKLKEKVKVNNITFIKIPDVNGDGICTVELDTGAGRSKNVQVPFRIFTKRKLFVLKEAGKKDTILGKRDIFVKETYMNGRGAEYPVSIEDVIGKVLKRDVPTNTIMTNQMLEEPVVVQRGEVVNIIAENKRLLIQLKGKMVDKGRMGDMVRVKNISSGREITGRVTANNAVTVDF